MRNGAIAFLLAAVACEVEGEGPPSQPFYDGGFTVEGDLPADFDVEDFVAQMEPGEFAVIGDPVTGSLAWIENVATPLARVANAEFTTAVPAACTNCGGGCPPTGRNIRVTMRHNSGYNNEVFTVSTARAVNFANPVTSPSSFTAPVGSTVQFDTTGDVQDCSRTFSYRFNINARPRAFVTNGNFNGNLGGVSGANATCQSAATNANLGGTWRAWLGSTAGAPSAGFTANSGPWVFVDSNVTVANSLADLTDGSILNRINRTETGATLAAKAVWTGLNSPNTPAADNCGDWTRSTVVSGRRGSTGSSAAGWIDNTTAGCNLAVGLYCFEQ